MADRFQEILAADDPLLESFWLPLYRSAFPADERVPEKDHRQAAAEPDQHVLVGLDGDRPVSMARYDVISEAAAGPYAYLMYMAVDETAVSRGHGQQIFGEIVRRVAEDPAAPRLIIFEVQRPDIAIDTEPYQSASRRIDFYRRQGAEVVAGVDYVQRIEGQPDVPMYLMARLIVDTVKPAEARSAAIDMFGDDVRLVGLL